VTAADLLVLAPWLIFGAALGVICYRLFARRRASRRHRDSRWWVPRAGHGRQLAAPSLPAAVDDARNWTVATLGKWTL